MIRIIFLMLSMFTVNICNAAVTIFPPIDYGTFTISSQIDFGVVALGSGLQPEITIVNTGTSVLQLGSIASTNTVEAPFRLVDLGCANSFIQPGDQCSIMVLFEPTEVGPYLDNFNIEIVSEGISHEVTLNGQGAALADESDILVSFSSINLGTLDVLETTNEPYLFPPAGSLFSVIYVENKGDLDLLISSVTVAGSTEVTVMENCVATIAPGNSCGFSIEFKPLTPGITNAVISIVSNDRDEAVFNFLIRAVAAGEDDGVLAVIEDAGPNNGDGNNDGILDSKQSNVVTLVDSYGSYVTYLTDSGFRFKDMSVLQDTEVPADFVIGSGIFDFTLEEIGLGQSVEVGVILPAGMIPDSYHIYGATADNPDKHWFNFDYDGETGAIILGDVTFTTGGFRGSVLKLIVEDGGRGDADMTVNGVITVTAAMPITISTRDSSGSMNILYVIFTFLVVALSRRIFNY